MYEHSPVSCSKLSNNCITGINKPNYICTLYIYIEALFTLSVLHHPCGQELKKKAKQKRFGEQLTELNFIWKYLK